MSLEEEARPGHPLEATDEEVCAKVCNMVYSDRYSRVTGLCHFVISSFCLALWRGQKSKNATRKDGITKKKQKDDKTRAKRQKNEICHAKRRKNAMRKDENTMQNNAI